MDVKVLSRPTLEKKNMKKPYTPPCQHKWVDVFVFKDIHGDRYLQQQCKKCKLNQHIKLPNDQNGSNSEVNKNGSEP